MQHHFYIAEAEFRGGNELLASDNDGMKLSIQIMRPKVQKFVQNREFGGDIIVLPQICLQEIRVIRQVIGDLRRCEAVVFELFLKSAVDRVRHMCSPFSKKGQYRSLV